MSHVSQATVGGVEKVCCGEWVEKVYCETVHRDVCVMKGEVYAMRCVMRMIITSDMF